MRYVYEYAAEIGISRETVGSIKTLLMLAAFLTVSVAFYSSYEGWTIGGSLTFVIVTMSTVGKQCHVSVVSLRLNTSILTNIASLFLFVVTRLWLLDPVRR